MNRRKMLRGMAAAPALAMTGCGTQPKTAGEAPKAATLNLPDYRPRSMLVVPETQVLRAKFPVIDVHTHVYMFPSLPGKDLGANPVLIPREQVDQIVKWMDELNVRTLINSTGGYGENLKKAMADLPGRYPG